MPAGGHADTVRGDQIPAAPYDPEIDPHAPSPAARRSLRFLGRTGLVLLAVAVAAKGLGFVRDVLLAALFGTSRDTDGFFLVFALWVQVAITLAGSCVQVFVPRWHTAHRTDGDAGTRRLLGGTLLAFGAVLTAGAALVAIAAEPVVGAVAPEFDAQARAATAQLLRLAAPVLPLSGLAGVLVALAHARGHYLFVKAAALGMNAGILAALLIGGRSVGLPAAAAGCTLGAILTLGLTALYPVRHRHVPAISGRALAAGLAILGGVATLTVLGHSGGYLMQLATRSAWARLPGGQLTSLAYATRVIGLPVQMIQFAILTTLIGVLSARVATGRLEEAAELGRSTLRVLLFALLPLTMAVVLLREPIVRLLFERGAFTAEATALTALLLGCLAPATLFAMVRNVIATAWYARGALWLPNAVGVLGVVVFVVGAGPVMDLAGGWGLALLQGLASATTLAVLAVLSKPVIQISWAGVGPVVLRVLDAAVPGLAFVAGMEYFGARAAPDGSWDLAVVALGLAGGAGLYVWRARSAGLGPELGMLAGLLRRREDG